VDALVDDHAGDRVVGVVVGAPVAEHDVRPRDAEGLDELQPRLARVEQELVVKVEPEELRPKDRGGVLCFLMSHRGDLFGRQGR
jgi:hypothetical protein